MNAVNIDMVENGGFGEGKMEFFEWNNWHI